MARKTKKKHSRQKSNNQNELLDAIGVLTQKFEGVEEGINNLNSQYKAMQLQFNALSTYRSSGLGGVQYEDRRMGSMRGPAVNDTGTRNTRISVRQFVH